MSDDREDALTRPLRPSLGEAVGDLETLAESGDARTGAIGVHGLSGESDEAEQRSRPPPNRRHPPSDAGDRRFGWGVVVGGSLDGVVRSRGRSLSSPKPFFKAIASPRHSGGRT